MIVPVTFCWDGIEFNTCGENGLIKRDSDLEPVVGVGFIHAFDCCEDAFGIFDDRLGVG